MEEKKYIIPENIQGLLGTDNFLKNFNSWNKDIAKILAQVEEISLNKEHWDILYFFRDFYEKNHTHPNIRNLINYLRKKENVSSYSLLLKKVYLLFPNGAIRQASKISGLNKPEDCFFHRYY